MERTLMNLLKKYWLVNGDPTMAIYTFKWIITKVRQCVSEEFSNFNLFPKFKTIRRSQSCPYFHAM